MAYTETSQRDGVNAGDSQNFSPKADTSPLEPPPRLTASVAELPQTQRILNLVRPVRAAAFGGILVFATLLALLVQHSPNGQSMLLATSLFGLPMCLVAWHVASSVQRRMSHTKDLIEQRVYGAGMHVDDQGRVLTDNPHPVLILDPAIGSLPNMS
jgi:hypothetical protein